MKTYFEKGAALTALIGRKRSKTKMILEEGHSMLWDKPLLVCLREKFQKENGKGSCWIWMKYF